MTSSIQNISISPNERESIQFLEKSSTTFLVFGLYTSVGKVFLSTVCEMPEEFFDYCHWDAMSICLTAIGTATHIWLYHQHTYPLLEQSASMASRDVSKSKAV